MHAGALYLQVKGVMADNIERVLARGEKLDTLVDKTDNLMFEVRPEDCVRLVALSKYQRQTPASAVGSTLH